MIHPFGESPSNDGFEEVVFGVYADTDHGQAHPLGGGLVDKIVRLRRSGQPVVAEATLVAAQADVLADFTEQRRLADEAVQRFHEGETNA